MTHVCGSTKSPFFDWSCRSQVSSAPHPLSLAPAQIPREHTILEFHFNSGKWDYNCWGHPGEPGVGSGAELWVWMGDRAAVQMSTDARWKVLQNLLSGLFCTSLGSMDVLHTTSPAHTFPPPGNFPCPHAMHTPYAMPHSSWSVCHGTGNLKP
ncbi:Gpi16 subunit, GPI transamidase component-domain-containing protein, partial [Lactarius sanguifluus]